MFEIVVASCLLFIIGAAVGSFLNVVLYRSIIGQDWVTSRSRCDTCKKQIRWFDNIPLLSYALLGGRCRYCKDTIALSHPVIEFLTGTLFVWWYWGGTLFFQLTQAPFTAVQPIFWLVVGVLLIMIFMADLLYLLIPDIAVILLLVMTIVYRVGLTLMGIMEPMDLLKALLGMVVAVVFFGSLWLVTKGRGMGMGDVKLVGPLALLLGWPNILVGLFMAFVGGALVGLCMIALGKRKMGQVLPFGPFLVIGTVMALLVGDQLMAWYMSMI